MNNPLFKSVIDTFLNGMWFRLKRGGILLFVTLSTSTTFGQSIDWASVFQGNHYVVDNDIAVDKYGSIYTIGWFTGTVDFDPGPNHYDVTSNGNEDIFVTKLDSEGNFIWMRHFGGNGWDSGNSISVDDFGNVIITGHFSETVNFLESPQVYNLSSAGEIDIFVAKLKASGTLQWAKVLGGPTIDIAYSITFGHNGSILTTGRFTGTSDFDPGNGVYNLSGFSGAFVSSISPTGEFEWAKQFVGATGLAIAADEIGNIYTTGTYHTAVDFDPGPGTFIIGPQGGFGSGGYISKLDSQGNFVFAKEYASGMTTLPSDIMISALGYIYVSGSFGGNTYFEPNNSASLLSSNGVSDAFVCKFDENINFVWCRGFGEGFMDRANSVTVDCSENVYVLGSFGDTVDFDPGPEIHELACAGTSDVFILKLDSLGEYLWVSQLGGPGQDESSSIVLGRNSSIYAFTKFSSQAVFTLDTVSLPLTSTGEYGATVLKINQCNNPISSQPISVSSCGNYVSPSGITYTYSGTFTEVLSNLSCCDSIVEIDLTIIPFNTSVTIESNILTANGAGTYMWLNCDDQFAAIPGETFQTFQPNSNGNFALVISENSCVDTTDCFYINSIGINEQTINGVKVYPNPTGFSVNLLFEEEVEKEIQIYLFNNVGALVNSNFYEINGPIELQLPDPVGVYMVQIFENDGSATSLKVIKK